MVHNKLPTRSSSNLLLNSNRERMIVIIHFLRTTYSHLGFFYFYLSYSTLLNILTTVRFLPRISKPTHIDPRRKFYFQIIFIRSLTGYLCPASNLRSPHHPEQSIREYLHLAGDCPPRRQSLPDIHCSAQYPGPCHVGGVSPRDWWIRA